MSKILLTGGGTAGHATPNIALLPTLKKDGHEVIYIGTKSGIERELVEKTNTKYYPISAGKLRRYLSFKNATDVFRIIKGYFDALNIIKKEKPDLVFSKGGFVTVPVVYAAHSKNVPIIIHESDMTPGLANKLCLKKADRVCVSFESTIKNIPGKECVLTGLPVRNELFNGNKDRALNFLGFDYTKPILLVIGGSLGAQAINIAVDESIDKLLEIFNVIHIRGKGKLNEELNSKYGYKQFEYVAEELSDLMTAADIVLSRAGANVIFELLALQKPMLLVPLPLESSRGDQILNADYFENNNFARILEQSSITGEKLVSALSLLLKESDSIKQSMKNSTIKNGTNNVISVIYSVLEEKK